MTNSKPKTTIKRRGFIAVMAGASSAAWTLLRGRRSKPTAAANEPKPPKWIGHQ